MVSSKNKGSRGEKQVVELCKKWWKSDDFMRSPESGALSTMLEGFGAPADIIGRLAGDLLVPEDFPFCVESKFYQEIDLYSAIRNPENCLLSQWWQQVKRDAEKANKIPLLTFKENRKPRYVMLSWRDLEELGCQDDMGCGYFESRFAGDIVRIFLWNDMVKLFPKDKIT